MKTLNCPKIINDFNKPIFQDITPLFDDGVPFLVDGDALMLTAILDKNYNPSFGGQFLHLVYICERILQVFTNNGGVCQIVFFDIWKEVYNNSYKLLVCRQVLYHHFMKNTQIHVHKIKHFYSSDFISIIEKVKSRFLLCNLAVYKDYFDIIKKVGEKPKFINKWPSIIMLFCGELLSCISNDLACVDIEGLTTDVSTVSSFIVEGNAEVAELSQTVHDNILNEFTINDDCPSLDDCVLAKNARETAICNAAINFLILHPKRVNDLRLILVLYATLDCFKLRNRGCPRVWIDSEETRKDVKDLIDIWVQLLYEVLTSATVSSIDEWKNVGDLWQGTLFSTILCAIKEDICDAQQLGAISGRYEYYVHLINEHSKVLLDPYPVKPIATDVSYKLLMPKCKSHGNIYLFYIILDLFRGATQLNYFKI